ncbi:hypothetical protein [Chenggangzhangella methanolivorans]|uniref:Uncharacterized protein n=1 Tax=Chenggangzhangella methanolivorans TaxID=1437009 RepID=A0A9E6R7R4_9HYPH|nr:hypothetical protein [Chenggangzhangella methanolivorans]QZN99563.1 hypothetical protein K6K41_23105 [Chenggangzhangella methanolivorans]
MPTRFVWTRTWPNDKNRVEDGHVPARLLDTECDVLRVFQIIGGPQNGLWYWVSARLKPAGDDGKRWPSNHDGFCATKEEAQAAAEHAYLDWPGSEG